MRRMRVIISIRLCGVLKGAPQSSIMSLWPICSLEGIDQKLFLKWISLSEKFWWFISDTKFNDLFLRCLPVFKMVKSSDRNSVYCNLFSNSVEQTGWSSNSGPNWDPQWEIFRRCFFRNSRGVRFLFSSP